MRRTAQLLAFRPDLEIVPMRGNVDTRLRKLEEEDLAAVVLACAGLERLGLASRIHQRIEPERMLPAVNQGMLHGKLWTTFGWELHVTGQVNPRSLRNFPMQANGAEMLRLGCIRATEDGVRVCAPVHDAILIEAPSRQ